MPFVAQAAIRGVNTIFFFLENGVEAEIVGGRPTRKKSSSIGISFGKVFS